MKRLIIIGVLCGLLCGCGLFSTVPVPQSPHTSRSINETIDAKVARELPKALNAIIGQNVIDYGPYVIVVLLSVLLGKNHVDLKKITKATRGFRKKV